MTSSVLNGDNMVQNGIFWTIGKHLYFVYCPIISYQWIDVYRVESIDIGRISLTHLLHWNANATIPVNTMVFVIRDEVPC